MNKIRIFKNLDRLENSIKYISGCNNEKTKTKYIKAVESILNELRLEIDEKAYHAYLYDKQLEVANS